MFQPSSARLGVEPSLPMANKGREAPSYKRLNVIVTNDAAASIDEARGALKRRGVYVSMSQLIEIALLELFGRRDFVDAVSRHNPTARREAQD